MIIIWHNPRCSKSRQTLALLEQRGLDVTVRKYLEDVPGPDELRAVGDKLGMTAIEMMRVKEAVFKELGLGKDDADEDMFEAMAANPILIERPIVINGGKAAMGRPPENVLSIL